MVNEENVSEGIIDELNIISKKTGKTEVEVRELFNDILHSEGMELVEHHEACKLALEQTKKAIFSTKFITGSPEYIRMAFQVLHVTDNSPSVISTTYVWDDEESQLKLVNEETERIGYVSGVFRTAPTPDAGAGAPQIKPYFGILTLWGDAIQVLDELKEGQAYRLDLKVKVRTSFLELSLGFYQKPEPVQATLPEPKDVITTTLKPIQANEAHKHIGNNRLIHGIITHCETWIAKKTGRLTGKIVLMPAKSTSLTDKSLTVMWFANPELANAYKIGSECYVLAHIDSSIENGIIGNGRAIIPINPVLNEIPDLFSDDIGDWI